MNNPLFLDAEEKRKETEFLVNRHADYVNHTNVD
jgi:hypothetical protein